MASKKAPDGKNADHVAVAVPSLEKGSDSDTKLMLRVINVVNGEQWQATGIPKSYTVTQFKERIAQEHDVLRNKRLRLVFAGQMLQDSNTLDASRLVNGSVVHCVATEPLPPGHSAASASASASDATTDERPVVLGFERLRYAGLSDQEIASIRLQFHGPAAMQVRSPADLEALVQREEAWMVQSNGEQAAPQNPAAAPQAPVDPVAMRRMTAQQRANAAAHRMLSGEARQGTWGEFIIGFAVGFFLGMLALVFLILGGNSSQKYRAGVMVGLIMSFAWSTFISMNSVAPNDSSGGTPM